MVDLYCTCFHLSIHSSRPIQHQAFNLQKLIWFITSNHREAEATTALLQLCVDKGSFQLGWVSCEERLPSCRTAVKQLSPLCPDTHCTSYISK